LRLSEPRIFGARTEEGRRRSAERLKVAPGHFLAFAVLTQGDLRVNRRRLQNPLEEILRSESPSACERAIR
jgi:hypothetical protein